MTQSICPSAPAPQASLAFAMDYEPANRRMLMYLVAGGLAAWGLMLGLGSFLGLDPATPDYDIRRFLIITGCVGAFLAFWGVALWTRRGRR